MINEIPQQATSEMPTLGLTPASLRVVRELGFGQWTPIQEQAVPVLLCGADLVGQSATGSGKTVAFGLPLLERLALDAPQLQALVLCPTRELATQVAGSIRALARHRPGLRVVILAGGTPATPQRQALEQGVHVAVGTPGRVLDHLARGLDLSSLTTIVLDEADRMLEMGFGVSVEKILSAAPTERQTLFFSATFPQSIAAMSKRWQRKPIHITIADDAATKPEIRQVAHVVAPADRLRALVAVLRAHRPRSVLVFCNFKETVRAVTTALTSAQFGAEALHGDLEQRDRDRVMAKFRNGTTPILVATDVAARGLDISGLTAVIQFELATTPATYVHRIGRTGRAGTPGLAIALVVAADQQRLQACDKASGGCIEHMPLPTSTTAKVMASENQSPVVVGTVETLFISGGRVDKLRPSDILGALTGDAGLQATAIGRIEISDRFTYVALSAAALQQLLRRHPTLRIKAHNFRVERVR